MTSEKRLARGAGALYLVTAVGGGFAEILRTKVIVPGDATTTASNVRDSAALFRLGFVSDLVQATFFLITAMALYLLLRHANELVARAMVLIVAVSVAIICLNMLNQYVALGIATGTGFPAGSDRLSMLFVDMHRDGYLIAQIFFGLWLLPLGYLVVRSGYFPRVLGYLLAVGGVGLVADTFVRFLAPALGETIAPILVTSSAIGELSFMAWLLVMGARAQERTERALVPAAA